MLLLHHLSVGIIITPELSEEEFEHEATLMGIRNQAAVELIRGEIDVEVYENILDATGINPINWLKEVEETITRDSSYG